MQDSGLKENTAAVNKLFGTAAKLAQKQAALATLNNVTLPKIYYAIGKKLVGLEKLPPELAALREKIRTLEAGIAQKPEDAPAAPVEGFAAKAKLFAQQAAQKASKATADATATMQIHTAYVSLGKTAVEKYGDKAIPREMHESLTAALKQRVELEAHLASLKQAAPAWLPLSSGLAVAGILLFAVSWFLPATNARLFYMSGWQAFRAMLDGSVLGKASALTNVVAFVSIAVLCGWHGRSRAAVQLMQLLLGGCIALNSLFLFAGPSIGYFAWIGAFVLMFLAMRRLKQQAANSPELAGDMPLGSPRWSILRAIAVASVSVVVINSLLQLMSSAQTPTGPDTQVATSTGSGALEPPQPDTTSDRPGETQSRVDAAQMFMNAIFSAAAIRHAEEQRIQRRESDKPKMICPTCQGTGSRNPDNPLAGGPCILCGGTGIRKIGR